MNNEIKLKIVIDNKEAVASLELTDENIKELYKSFKYGKQEVNGFTTQLSMGFNNAREILQGFNEVVSVFQRTFGRSVQLYGIQEEAEKQLATALGRTSQELLNYASAMQQKTTHGDEEIIRAQSLIASFVKEEDQIKLLTKATLDLADAKGMDLQTAADLLTKSVASSTNALSRYGIEVKGAAGSSERLKSAIDAVEKAFGGQAEALAETNIGAMKQFGNLIGDVQEGMGFLVASGLKPFVEHLSYLIKSLNSINPLLSSGILAVGSLGSAYMMLKTLGLTPLAKQMFLTKAAIESGIATTMKAAIADAGLTTANLTLTSSFRALGVAIKSSFGWFGIALVGITAVIEAIGFFAGETDEANKKMSESEMRLRVQQKEFSQLAEKVQDANLSLDARKKVLAEIQEKYPGYLSNIDLEKISQEDLAKAIKEANDEFERSIRLKVYREKYEEALRKEIELEEQIKKKREEAEKIKQSEGDEFSTEMFDLEKVNDELSELIEKQTKVKEEADNWRKKIDEVNASAKTGTKELTKQATVAKKIKEIEEEIEEKKKAYLSLSPEEAEKAKAKFEREIAKLQNELKRYKLQIPVTIKAEVKVKYTPVDDVEEKGLETPNIPKVKIPTELETQPVAEDFQELQDMKLASIRDEAERERTFLDAQYQADLERYKGVIGAKEIIDKYYHEQKRELERQTTEMQIRTALNTLNFVGSAVNQYTAAGKGIAVANAIWNTYQAATEALKLPVPLNFAMMPLVLAAGFEQERKIVSTEAPKIPQFAEGGRLPEGKPGYVEGWHDELIAPEKTFVEIFQQELRPKIYNEAATQSVVIQNKELANKIDKLGDSIINRPLKAELHVGKVAARDIVKHGQKQIEREGL